jgi:hypothetical protein
MVSQSTAGLDAGRAAEDRAPADPAIEAAPVVADQVPVALDSLYEVKVVVSPTADQDDVSDRGLASPRGSTVTRLPFSTLPDIEWPRGLTWTV